MLQSYCPPLTLWLWFQKQCVHTEGFLRRPVLDQGAHSGLRHFTGQFPQKVALVKSWHAFRLRRLAQSVRPRSGLSLVCCILRHFTCKFAYNVALVKSWHAFRARRLAQSVCVCPRSGLNLGRSISLVNFCKKGALVKSSHELCFFWLSVSVYFCAAYAAVYAMPTRPQSAHPFEGVPTQAQRSCKATPQCKFLPTPSHFRLLLGRLETELLPTRPQSQGHFY